MNCPCSLTQRALLLLAERARAPAVTAAWRARVAVLCQTEATCAAVAPFTAAVGAAAQQAVLDTALEKLCQYL